jgi:MFS family permease
MPSRTPSRPSCCEPSPGSFPPRTPPGPRYPRSVARLTTGYSVGQILGPLAVAPLLHHGYRQALLLAAVVVLAAARAAGVLRIGFPHHRAVVRGSAPGDRPAAADAVPASTDRH